MAMEIEATAPGRRVFIEVHTTGGAKSLADALAVADATGAVPRAESFRVQHIEYEADALDGYDHDIGRVIHADVVASTVNDVASTLRAWGHDPADPRPYFQIDAP
jgi:hypothetical protein